MGPKTRQCKTYGTSCVWESVGDIACCCAFQFKIRKEALLGLGQIYRRCCELDASDEMRQMSWIRNKVLHAYYHSAVDDKYAFTAAMLPTVIVAVLIVV